MDNKIFHNVHASNEGVFSTVSGCKINILSPDHNSINIDDIAHHLSLICRFGGMVNEFYSVAQHSLLVSYLAPDGLELHGLLHDASEAYLGDVIKPLKNVIGKPYQEIEVRFMKAISEKFAFSYHKLAAIKEADKLALELEHQYLKLGDIYRFRRACQDFNIPEYPLCSAHAKYIFMKRFEYLMLP